MSSQRRHTPSVVLNMKITGYMISFKTWETYIRLSLGSDAMKERVISHVILKFGRPELLDSFELGLLMGEFSNTLSDEEDIDWLKTIELTRDTDNVPIVKREI